MVGLPDDSGPWKRSIKITLEMIGDSRRDIAIVTRMCELARNDDSTATFAQLMCEIVRAAVPLIDADEEDICETLRSLLD